MIYDRGRNFMKMKRPFVVSLYRQQGEPVHQCSISNVITKKLLTFEQVKSIIYHNKRNNNRV